MDSKKEEQEDEAINKSLTSITFTDIESYTKNFLCANKSILSMNIVTHILTSNASLSHFSNHNTQNSIEIKKESKPITHQHSTGRCWIYGALNCIRIPFIEKYNLESFEFSQSYLFF